MVNQLREGHSPVKKERERNLIIENPTKISITLTVFLQQFLDIGKLYVFKKEREKLKRFCFIIVKLVNELCYILQSSDLDTFLK